MKSLLKLAIFGLAVAFTSLTGCIKDEDLTNNVNTSDLPNVFGFSISKAGSFLAGMSSNIQIQAAGLGSGDFTVHYNLGGANSGTDLTAVMNMVNGVGNFKTQTLATNGNTNLTITSVTNSSNKTSTITGNNTATIKVGSIAYTRNGTAGSSDEAYTSIAGSMLSIHGVKWDPLTTVTLYVDHYATAPITVNFSSASGGGGSAGFTTTGVAQIAAHGTISITSVTPYITGTFSMTMDDSSHFTGGTFTVPAP